MAPGFVVYPDVAAPPSFAVYPNFAASPSFAVYRVVDPCNGPQP